MVNSSGIKQNSLQWYSDKADGSSGVWQKAMLKMCIYNGSGKKALAPPPIIPNAELRRRTTVYIKWEWFFEKGLLPRDIWYNEHEERKKNPKSEDMELRMQGLGSGFWRGLHHSKQGRDLKNSREKDNGGNHYSKKLHYQTIWTRVHREHLGNDFIQIQTFHHHKERTPNSPSDNVGDPIPLSSPIITTWEEGPHGQIRGEPFYFTISFEAAEQYKSEEKQRQNFHDILTGHELIRELWKTGKKHTRSSKPISANWRIRSARSLPP